MSLTCKCGTSIFKEIAPIEIAKNNFMVWHPKDHIAAKSVTIAAAECLGCGRLYIPSCSMSGQNRLKPEVILYGRLIEAVKVHNERIDKLDDILTMSASVRELEPMELMEYIPNYYTKDEIDEMLTVKGESDEQAGIPSGKATVKNGRRPKGTS